MKNIFSSIPDTIDDEVFDDLLKSDSIRIERILSKGQRSPDDYWYDQDENEWVVVLQGEAVIALSDGHDVRLMPGGYLNIPAHTKHRLSWTKPDEVTVWLAVFYK